jgi:hypothetical protein
MECEVEVQGRHDSVRRYSEHQCVKTVCVRPGLQVTQSLSRPMYGNNGLGICVVVRKNAGWGDTRMPEKNVKR